MGRTASTTTDAAEPRQPEIITSAHLANILTLELVEMISEATKRYEAAHLSRVMDAVLSALRGTVRDVRALHRLPAINWQTGQPVGEPVASDNGAEPEAAEGDVVSDETRREPGTPLPGVNGIPGPNALDEDVWDQRTPEQMATDWERAHRPTPPGPPDPAALEQRAHRAVDAVGGVGHVDPWDEPEPARRDLYDRTAWIERMAWRNAFLIMFVIGVVSFAFGLLAWPYAAALALGGLVPGLFLMAREQGERNVEADRAMNRPETRHDGTMPPLRRTVRSFNDGIDE